MPFQAAKSATTGGYSLWGLGMTPLSFWLLVGFVIIIVGCFLWFGWLLSQGQRKAAARLSQLDEILKVLKQKNPIDQRQAALEKAELLRIGSKAAPDAWKEFDESLVVSADGQRLLNTVDADYFFDTETLAGEALHSRILTFLPSALTAFGVLGTFVGLVVGLWGLELGADADSDKLRAGVAELISGASLAFITSILGVLASLIANLWGHNIAKRVSRNVRKVQEEIDQLFGRHTVDQSLIAIERSSLDSNTALQELHEKIGYELQKAVTGLSQDMQAAVTAALESSIAPAMTQLGDSASKQSSELFDNLVGKFASAFENIGTRQAESLTTAASSVTDSLGSMGDDFNSMMDQISKKVGDIMDGTAEQSAASQKRLEELMVAMTQQRQHTEEIVARLAETVDEAGSTMKTSSHHLQTSARELEKVSEGFTDASEKITDHVTASTQLLESSADKLQVSVDVQRSIVDSLNAQQNAMIQVREQMESTATSLDQAAQNALQGFSAMEAHQASYLESLSREFAQITGQLTQQVEDMEKSMREWLDEYSKAVSSHTQTRLEEWNAQSQGYASNMLRISEGLANTLEEIDDLKGRMKGETFSASNS